MLFFRDEKRRNADSGDREWRSLAATAVAATIVFGVVLAAPVTIDLDDGIWNAVSLKTAIAGKGNGGGKGGGGGNGGGNGGGDNGSGNGGNGNGGAKADNGRNPVWRAFTAGPKVKRAVFTTEIRNRSPQDDITELSDPDQYITFFTDLRKMDGMQVTHRWIHEDVVRYEMTFTVMADKWQAWSTQRLPVDAPGAWTVEVIDEDGKVLAAEDLIFLAKASGRSVEKEPAPGGLSGTIDRFKDLLNL